MNSVAEEDRKVEFDFRNAGEEGTRREFVIEYLQETLPEEIPRNKIKD